MSRWRSFRGVQGKIGTMGAGKTYLATRDAVMSLRAGRDVWTNAGYRVVDPESGRSSQTFVSINEMLLAPAGTDIYLDEIGTFMNARKWTELPRGLMYRLTQARKDSLSLTYTAQHEMQVDVAIRRLTQIMWHVKRLGPFMCATAWPPIDYRKADDRPMERRYFVLREGIMACYDTLARVWVPPETLDELMGDQGRWIPLDERLMERRRKELVAARDELEAGTPSDSEAEDGDGTEPITQPLPRLCGPASAWVPAHESFTSFGECTRCKQQRAIRQAPGRSWWLCRDCWESGVTTGHLDRVEGT